jgi:hypothetical protein
MKKNSRGLESRMRERARREKQEIKRRRREARRAQKNPIFVIKDDFSSTSF